MKKPVKFRIEENVGFHVLVVNDHHENPTFVLQQNLQNTVFLEEGSYRAHLLILGGPTQTAQGFISVDGLPEQFVVEAEIGSHGDGLGVGDFQV